MNPFAARPSFYIDGKKEYHTILGGILTVIVFIITIGCSFYFAQEIWQKNHPTVNTATLITNHPKKMLYPDPFFFMITVDVDYIPTIDESIYFPRGNIHITHVDKNGTSTTERKYFNMKVCTEIIDENHIYYDLLKDFNLNNFYCMPKFIEKENDISLNDYWGNDGFNMLQVKIYTCGIYNDNTNCKSDKEISKILSDSRLSYYTINEYVDTTNYSYPFSNGLDEHYLALSIEKRSTFTTFIKHIDVESDYGLIFSRKKKEYGITVDSYIDLPFKEDVKNGYLFGISIQLTNTIDFYKRSYYKLQNLCEDISAIYGVLMIIIKLIERYYNESKLAVDLINSFFLIKGKNKEKKIFDIKKDTYTNISRLFKSDIISLNNKTKGISFKKVNKLIKRRKKKENEESIISDAFNINKYNIGYKFKMNNKNNRMISSNIIKHNIKNNKFYRKFFNSNKNKNQIITQNKLEFKFYQHLICLNCCIYWRQLDKNNKKNDYDLYDKGMKYISELLEIKNIMKKISIDNIKYSLDCDELIKQRIEEISRPELSMEIGKKKLPLFYFGKFNECEES